MSMSHCGFADDVCAQIYPINSTFVAPRKRRKPFCVHLRESKMTNLASKHQKTNHFELLEAQQTWEMQHNSELQILLFVVARPVP